MTFDLSQVDPELRSAARFLPRGYALNRGLTLSRSLMAVAARAGRLRDVEVCAVNDDVSVRVHRSSGEASLAYARRLSEAGVDVCVEVADGGYHAFDLIVPKAAASQRFFTSQCDSLRAAVALRS